MAIDNDCVFDLPDLTDLELGSLIDINNTSPLCIPQDSISDIDFFPNFADDLIYLDRDYNNFIDFDEGTDTIFSLNTPSPLPERVTNKRITEEQCCETSGAINFVFGQNPKKQRSKKRVSKRAWTPIPIPLGFPNKKKKVSKRGWTPAVVGFPNKEKRRCTHCQTESTPQWRAGPLGPKTLCNACGVRYKSGRLLPEYRPVASPTFDVQKHSNYHKRILKKRKIVLSH
ncbi:hypothetical protein ACFE04_018389 [Oxalis oulophora]